jgi:hypothetical protein
MTKCFLDVLSSYLIGSEVMDSKLGPQHTEKSLGKLKVLFQEVLIFSIILNVSNKTSLTIEGTTLKIIISKLFKLNT